MWTLKSLINWQNDNQAEINGKWVPVRPEVPFGFSGFGIRLREALKVLRGEADCFVWPENQ